MNPVKPIEISQLLDRILPTVQKPGRYTGGELNQVVKDWGKIRTRIALVFPDIYDLGMSNLGLAILYDIINSRPNLLAERVYSPWTDMEDALRKTELPIFSLETRHPLIDFDIIGFSLNYELTYTNVLQMLDLAGIPVAAQQRNDSFPLIIAGGSCVLNPEPMSDFIDAFVMGEGEEVTHELFDTVLKWKHNSTGTKKDLLQQLVKILWE